jgi:hypothetical protein
MGPLACKLANPGLLPITGAGVMTDDGAATICAGVDIF